MKITNTELPGVLIVEPQVFGDNRGWFFESYSKIKLENQSLSCDFVQDNHAFSLHKNTLRGLHFQNPPKAQAKLVRCSRGRILDVAVDIRRDSPNFCKWVKIELSEDNKLQLFIPKGFAHAYLTLTDNCEVQYKTDEYYSPEHEMNILWNDPDIKVDWGDIDPILAEKDRNGEYVKNLKF